MRDIHIHIHLHAGPDKKLLRRLAGIEAAQVKERKDIDDMTKVTDAAIKKLTEGVAGLTSELDSVLALIDGAVQAQRDLATEMAAEGNDVTALTALSDAIEANRSHIAARTVQNTPSDTGAPVPPIVATA